MSWVKLDDAIAEHRKVVALEDYEAPCAWLNVKAIAWSNRQLADGLIPKAVVRRLASTFLGRLRLGQQVVAADDLTSKLIEVGLWIDEGDAIRINDYLRYQPSKAEVEAKRAADAQRKRDGRATDGTKRPHGVRVDKPRSPSGQTSESEPPDPARSDPREEKSEESAPRGGHRIPADHPLAAATEAILHLRGCRNSTVCHRAFVDKELARGRYLADWHAEERRLAQLHNERDACHRTGPAPVRRDLAAEGRARREQVEAERKAATGGAP